MVEEEAGDDRSAGRPPGVAGQRGPLRRRLIVDRALQYNLVTRVAILVLFTFCLVSAALFAPLVRRIDSLDGGAARELAETLLFLQARLWPVAIVCLAVAVAGAIFISHRIAGPLVRVKRALRFLAEGHFPQPVETRPHDYFKAEVDLFNGSVARLAERLSRVRQAHADVEAALAECEERAHRSVDRDLRQACVGLAEKSATVGDLLDGFSFHSTQCPEDAGPRPDPSPAAPRATAPTASPQAATCPAGTSPATTSRATTSPATTSPAMTPPAAKSPVATPLTTTRFAPSSPADWSPADPARVGTAVAGRGGRVT